VETIVFDKTGTLTEGRPRVQRVLAASSQLPEARLLALAAALERESSHPLASAILAAAQASGGCPDTCRSRTGVERIGQSAAPLQLVV